VYSGQKALEEMYLPDVQVMWKVPFTLHANTRVFAQGCAPDSVWTAH